ncbi:hypothetical protein M9Y10_008083 [Tritrichomonas musculus]|uniref:C2 domain-containing protein n=1 Tax=Tritrichomonas musculus TaxID=1915356 RepID=A0ABR2IY40_9EUKA
MKLDIQIFAARGLPRISQRSRQSPSCLIQIEGINQSFQTQAVKNATSPEWNESFTFEKVSQKEVQITLTVLNNSNTISYVNFTLTDISDGSQIDQWIDLVPENPKQKGGQIHISILFTQGEDDENNLEEEEEDVQDNNNDSLLNDIINEEQNDSPTPYSPHRTPDSKRIKERIINDNGDADELIEKSAKNANQRYNAFLKSRAPLLIENEKKMQKVRREIETENEEE